jgi:hypothetical protein
VYDHDTIAPQCGFDTHRRRDMEIVTWVLSGTLVHQARTDITAPGQGGGAGPPAGGPQARPESGKAEERLANVTDPDSRKLPAGKARFVQGLNA